MKLLRILSVIILFTACMACEKAVIDDEDGKGKTEKPIEKPGNTGSDDNNDSPNGNNDDPNDNSGDGDQIVEPGDDDSDKPFEETEITDGNNPGKDNNTGKEEEKPLSVGAFINKSPNGGVYVKGYIVGACTQNIKNADFDAPFKGQTAVLLADAPDERDKGKIISIGLKSGSKMRAEVNLEDNPDNKGRLLRVFGYRVTYLGIPGIKDVQSGMYKLF